MRAVFPLRLGVGRRRSTPRLVALAMLGAVAACNPDSRGSADSGDSGGGRDSANPTATADRGDSVYGRTFAVHSGHCADHAKIIADEVQRRYFLADCKDRARAAVRASAAFKLAGEMMLTIPEYHDEQAFPTGPGKYGPVASFYASPFLGTFRELWQIAEHGPRGILAAVIDVKANEGTALDAPYTRLHLSPGLNCLWLALEGSNWKAYVSQTAATVACDPNPANRKPLAVVRSNETGYGKDDYPAVTRFTEAAVNAGGDLGPAAGQPLLSVPCIDKWCEIGPLKPDGLNPDFQVSNPIGGILAAREHRIKGWHDEQWLATKNTSGQLEPKFRASFVPAKKINERKVSEFRPPAWISAAKVYLSDDPPNPSKYQKLGLRKGWNELRIQGEGQLWKGHWINGGVKTPEFEVYRVGHYDAAVPGTARFRWQSNDDSMWAACGQACCRVEPIS